VAGGREGGGGRGKEKGASRLHVIARTSRVRIQAADEPFLVYINLSRNLLIEINSCRAFLPVYIR